jgi:hypothetical protein
MEWQLEYPGSSREEASVWLKGEVEAGRISIEGAVPRPDIKETK